MHDRDLPRNLNFHPSARPVVYFGPFRLDLADGLLSRAGEEIRLPPRALAILQHLVERAGRIVSKQSLMDVAWRDAHVSETSLTEAVGLIRQALDDDPQHPSFIQTVHRRGYRFIAVIATEAPPDPNQPSDGSDRVAAAAVRQTTMTEPPPSTQTRRAIAAGVAGTAVLVALIGLWASTPRRPPADERTARVNVAIPSAQAPLHRLNSHPIVTLSPDGERFVYVGRSGSNEQLFLREMNQFDATPLPGTEGAHGPFFSPDGAWVAFFSRGQLQKVRVTGGDRAGPQVLCATETGVGGTWVSANDIVFAPNWRGPLMRVPASGGQPSIAVPLPADATYRWPDRLDDQTILATRWRSSAADASVVAISLASGAERTIVAPATFGRYAASGHVLFVRDGDLYAIGVDRSSHQPRGTPTRVVPAVMIGMTGAAQFAISPRGSLLYIDDAPERSQRTIARGDSQGRSADLPIPPRSFRSMAVCDDRLAATVFERGRADLWTGRVDRAAMTQITRDGAALDPVWSRDCGTIAFAWNRTGVASIYTVAIESGDGPRLLFESPLASAPGSWSTDGRWLAYTELHPETAADIWLWDSKTGHRRPVVATAAMDLLPMISPDGTHLAYETNVAGMFEVEVASIHTGARTQVSVGGGTWPSWSDDGRQLFFLHDTSIMRTGVTWPGGRIAAGNPAPLFTDPDIILFRRAGDQFLWLRRTAGAVPVSRMNLVLNWFSELDRIER